MSKETRPHQRTVHREPGTRTRMSITCPFCEQVTESYLWTLVADNAECACGATHTHYPVQSTKENTA